MLQNTEEYVPSIPLWKIVSVYAKLYTIDYYEIIFHIF